jgi:hypothetical protein
MRWTLAAIIAALSVAAAVPALAIDLDKFQKRVGKSAAPSAGFPEKPKATCVCQEASFGGLAGVLHQYKIGNRVAVDCIVPRFDVNSGALTGFNNCFQYVVLPR